MSSDTRSTVSPRRRRSTVLRLLGTLAALGAVVGGVLVDRLLIDGRGTLGLWHVVDEMCRPMMRWTGHPFPCLEVSTAGDYAVLHAPFDGSQILVVPLTHHTGIEDPAMRRPETRELWSVAWAKRHLVDGLAGRRLRDDEIGLAVNSESSRTQWHYHIHVDCLAPQVRRMIAARWSEIGADWTKEDPAPWAATYLMRRIDMASLKRETLERVVARELKPSDAAFGDLSIALLGTGQGTPDNPIFVLAVTFGENEDDGGHTEELLDHTCRAD